MSLKITIDTDIFCVLSLKRVWVLNQQTDGKHVEHPLPNWQQITFMVMGGRKKNYY